MNLSVPESKSLNSNLFFWQNIPSIHQAPLVREMARKWAGEVVVVAEDDISADRLAQGWTAPYFSPARLIVAPSSSERGQLLQHATPNGVQIFSGFHAYPKTYETFKRAIRSQSITGVFAEPGRVGGWGGVLRHARYGLHALRWGRRLDFLLATGELGVRYYRKCGFPASRIFPFGYFVEPAITPNPNSPKRAKKEHPAVIKFLFVGQLIERKGLDVLFDALSTLLFESWVLNIVGRGPERSELEELARRSWFAARVGWLDTLPNDQLRVLMGEADCLVLPSRYDGWGAVVNEALLAGTPAIVSDACGSSDLIRAPWRGDVFPSENRAKLAGALSRRVKNGPVTAQDRMRIRTWAEENISPQRAAEYLIDIIRFVRGTESRPRPVPPWRVNALD